MMGQKVFQEKFFYDISLSKRIPEDHILRRINEVVDLCFVRQLTASFYSHTGQPSVDPVVLFSKSLLDDSTLIRANASLKSVVPRSDAFEPLRSPKEHIEQVFIENPSWKDDNEPTSTMAEANPCGI